MKDELIRYSTEIMLSDMGISHVNLENINVQPPDPDIKIREFWSGASSEPSPDYLVPTQSLIARFLREIQKLFIRVDWHYINMDKEHYSVSVFDMKGNRCIYNSDNNKICFSTYEEAFETGIKEALSTFY